MLLGQNLSYTEIAKATYHVTLHLAVEKTSVAAELTQTG